MNSAKDYKLTFHRENISFENFLSICQPINFQPNDLILTPKEMEQFTRLIGNRAKEFFSTRFLAKNIFLNYFLNTSFSNIEITNGVFGQPILTILNSKVNYGISISHKNNLVGSVIFNEEHPIGLDIEPLYHLKEKVLKKILTQNESEMIKETSLNPTFLWTAKEALSKILRCGLTIPNNFLEVVNYKKKEKFYSGEFLHFLQYKFIGFSYSNHAITLVFPRNSRLKIEEIPQN